MAKAKTEAEKQVAAAEKVAKAEEGKKPPNAAVQKANTTLTVGGKAVSVVDGVAKQSDLTKKIGPKKPE